MQALLAALRPLLSKLNRDKFGYLWAQHEEARQKLVELQESLSTTPCDPLLLQQEHELRLYYSDIISSSLSLMRKLSSYIYTLKNFEGDNVEGLAQVGKLMSKFYTQLLGTKVWQRTCINPQILHAELQNRCLRVTGLHVTQFPLKYLGVPITTSRLTKIECNALIEKIIARVHVSATRNISFAGRALLINNKWWRLPLPVAEDRNLLSPLVKLKAPKHQRLISYAIFSASICNIWHARNIAIFKKQQMPSQQLIANIKTQIRYRILFMNKISHKYNDYIDRLFL
ncbi:hypothetical protein Cgig2_019538 [Carnegiea gigantea]|uniref:Uncharacterized protein n=1 Tax=Carnegiea gigantea TaxID=171969 RepID=A0A9Q1QJZ8_9CARY|nr:hypothetical protein Cgig2_019538 [Carnegiea gigantea]